RTWDSEGLPSNVATNVLLNLTPQIIDFHMQRLGSICTIIGRVDDESPAGLMVIFGGTVDAFTGQQVTVDANGYFQLTENIPSDLETGTITAQVTDWWGAQSDLATLALG